MAPYPGNDLAVDPTERRAAIVASRMRNRRTGMGDVRASPNDQNGVIGMIGPDAPRPGVRIGDLNTGGYTAQKISQPVGPQSPYTAAPDSGGNRPTQEEGRTLRQMAEESMYGARSAARIARGRLFDLTKPGSVSSGAERAAGFAAVDDAKRVERNYEGDYNRLNNATKTLQSPETVAANRAELQRQFKMNTGGTGGRIPPDPRLDPAGFFTGNSAGEQVEKYPGAGQMAVRAAGANLNRQSLNAEQNRPRELAFDPLPSEAERRGPVDTTGPSAPEQMAVRLRSRRAINAARASGEAEQEMAGIDASTALAKSRPGMVGAATKAEESGLAANDAENRARAAVAESTAKYAPQSAEAQARMGNLKARAAERGLTREAEGVDAGFVERAAAVADQFGKLDGSENAGQMEAMHGSFEAGTIAPLEAMARSGAAGATEARNIASMILARMQVPPRGIYGLDPRRTMNMNEHIGKIEQYIARLQALMGNTAP